MVANLLDGIEVKLNTDYLEQKDELDALADKVVYTGPIDAFFDYKLGTLEYRSVRFENELLDKPSFQGNAAVNYTDREHHGLVLSNISGLSLARTRMETICLGLSSAVNIAASGSRVTSHIIRSTMIRTVLCMRNTRSWQMLRTR